MKEGKMDDSLENVANDLNNIFKEFAEVQFKILKNLSREGFIKFGKDILTDEELKEALDLTDSLKMNDENLAEKKKKIRELLAKINFAYNTDYDGVVH